MFELKTITRDAIPKALEKAERYRLLNEPRSAESICRDILRADPHHQAGLKTLILSLTDQFGMGVQVNITHAEQLLGRLESTYDRTYLAGVICERWAKCQLRENAPGHIVYDWFLRAMRHYEQAEPLSPPNEEDAKLRWNACARMIRRYTGVEPRAEEGVTDDLHQDDVPMHR